MFILKIRDEEKKFEAKTLTECIILPGRRFLRLSIQCYSKPIFKQAFQFQFQFKLHNYTIFFLRVFSAHLLLLCCYLLALLLILLWFQLARCMNKIARIVCVCVYVENKNVHNVFCRTNDVLHRFLNSNFMQCNAISVHFQFHYNSTPSVT